MKPFFLVVVVAACGGGSGDKPVDASRPIDAASPDARVHTGTAMSHTLFVNAEGVALSPGADDATTNKTSLITAAATLKPWRVGDAARVQKIMDAMGALQTTLAPYDIAIVTTRPAAGPYGMLVVTDDQSSALGSGFSGVGSVTSTGCNASGSVVSVAFPIVNGTATDAKNKNFIVNTGIAMFGIDNGIPVSNVAGDCMCLAAAACDALTQPCTIGGAGTTIDTGNGGAGTCGDTDATMDEGAKFLAAFGSH